MTRRAAVRQTMNMWRWLAKTGLRKMDYLLIAKKLSYDEASSIVNQCYLCHYLCQHAVASLRGKCPIFKYCSECVSSKYPYRNWVNSRNREESKQAARLVYLGLRRYYEKKFGRRKQLSVGKKKRMMLFNYALSEEEIKQLAGKETEAKS